MPRILFYSESSEPGGAETIVLRLADHFRQSPWDAVVLLMREGWLADEVRRLGLEPVVLESRRSFDLGFLLRLRSLIRTERIDLVHAHLPDSNAYASVAGALTGIPVIATSHGLIETFGPLSRNGRLKLWLVGRMARRIVAVSESMRQELLTRASYPPERTRCIYNGIDWSRLEDRGGPPLQREPLGIPAGARVIGMFGAIRPVKGHLYAIRALHHVHRSIPEAHLLIAGEEDPACRAQLDVEIQTLRLESHVTFLGFRSDVGRLLRILDLLIMPSLSEGHPLAIIEAMGMGVPVAASRVGGLPEIVQDGETGRLVPPGDDLTLARCIADLLSDRERSKTLAAHATQQVRDRFSIERMFDHYAALYNECLNQAHS